MYFEPTIICEICNKTRSCNLHLKAEFPPDAAKKYLKKYCETKDCKFKYQAGIILSESRNNDKK